MTMLLANSLWDGFLGSNAVGRGIVLIQVLCSIVMVGAIIGKWKQASFLKRGMRTFLRDFSAGADVLEYYFERRPALTSGLVSIYKDTCDRLLKQLAPDVRSLLAGHRADGNGAAALTAREIELVRGTCEHSLEDEVIRAEYGLGVIATVVALSPMLGLLGTVWGVLDAFAEMGTAGSANLATIAPSISAALVTTVVGLLIAIPGVIAFNSLNAKIRGIVCDMEGFADELMARVACEFQGRGA